MLLLKTHCLMSHPFEMTDPGWAMLKNAIAEARNLLDEPPVYRSYVRMDRSILPPNYFPDAEQQQRLILREVSKTNSTFIMLTLLLDEIFTGLQRIKRVS